MLQQQHLQQQRQEAPLGARQLGSSPDLSSTYSSLAGGRQHLQPQQQQQQQLQQQQMAASGGGLSNIPDRFRCPLTGVRQPLPIVADHTGSIMLRQLLRSAGYGMIRAAVISISCDAPTATVSLTASVLSSACATIGLGLGLGLGQAILAEPACLQTGADDGPCHGGGQLHIPAAAHPAVD